MGRKLWIPVLVLSGTFLFVSSVTGLWGVYFEKEWWMFFIPFVIGFFLGHIIAAAIFIGGPTPAPVEESDDG